MIGFDVYNMAVTGGVSKTLNSIKSDADHVPVVVEGTYSVHEADGQDVTLIKETAHAVVTGGGKPGQGYPCILRILSADES